MTKKTPLVVYWCLNTEVSQQHRVLLTGASFQSVMKDISKRRAKNPILPKTQHVPQNSLPRGSYHLCTALHNLADNMFYFPAPFDIDLEVDEFGVLVPSPMINWFFEREQTVDHAFNIDFDFEVNVFSEDSVEMSVTPPYLHQSSITKYGFIASTKWDIAQWFRPIVTLFQLWPGVRELHIKEGEPLFYVTFHTDRPIVFKQVRETERIRSITHACLSHKFTHQMLPLSKLYWKFKNQGLRDDLLTEMKNNIIKDTNV
jgi:hypothetical protein